MKVQTVSIIIERDTMTKIPKQVFPWEVPLFRAQYGDEKIEILELKEPVLVDVDDLPDAEEEYMRLRGVFGIEPDTKQSIVDIAYGRGGVGVDALKKAIKASAVTGKKAEPRSVEKAQKVADKGAKLEDDTKDAREDAYRDPLDGEDAEQDEGGAQGTSAGGPGAAKS